MGLYKLTEFQSPTGKYHLICNEMVGRGPQWHIPARLLVTPLDYFVRDLVEVHGATITKFVKSKKLLLFHWDSLEDCRKFKNLVNAKARKINYQI